MTGERVVLITGASSGLGRACSERLHERGYVVYGTSRQPEEIGEVPFDLIRLDVRDDESVQAAVENVIDEAGRIDVLVNNAGVALAGAVEDTTIEEAQAQMNTNFFGVLRMTRAVVPGMRAQESGLIINIGSIGGRFGLPFQAMYSASKFALEALSEALRIEVRPFGVRVVLVEAGDVATRITHNRTWAEASEGSIYHERAAKAVEIMGRDEQHGAPPEAVVRLVQRIIEMRNPKLRYTVGPMAERAAVVLRRVLPDAIVEWGLAAYYGSR